MHYIVMTWKHFGSEENTFWMLLVFGKLLKDFTLRILHETDGQDDAYVPRTHDGLLKWKYAHMNSVDFLF